MPNTSELNQYRRLIGDYTATPVHTDAQLILWLNDATNEITCDISSNLLATPLQVFDSLPYKYHNEAIYKAAINYWWDQLSNLQGRHSLNIGQTSQNVSEKWDRALAMIEKLQAHYDSIQSLDVHIDVGNFSRWSKQQLRRIGGTDEEDTRIV